MLSDSLNILRYAISQNMTNNYQIGLKFYQALTSQTKLKQTEPNLQTEHNMPSNAWLGSKLDQI